MSLDFAQDTCPDECLPAGRSLITPITFCYVCELAGVFREVGYDSDWMIFDTPVGSYEIHVCDEHYEDMPPLPSSAVAVVTRCLEYQVVHGG
jgi:hypothetical protein